MNDLITQLNQNNPLLKKSGKNPFDITVTVADLKGVSSSNEDDITTAYWQVFQKKLVATMLKHISNNEVSSLNNVTNIIADVVIQDFQYFILDSHGCDEEKQEFVEKNNFKQNMVIDDKINYAVALFLCYVCKHKISDKCNVEQLSQMLLSVVIDIFKKPKTVDFFCSQLFKDGNTALYYDSQTEIKDVLFEIMMFDEFWDLLFHKHYYQVFPFLKDIVERYNKMALAMGIKNYPYPDIQISVNEFVNKMVNTGFNNSRLQMFFGIIYGELYVAKMVNRLIKDNKELSKYKSFIKDMFDFGFDDFKNPSMMNLKCFSEPFDDFNEAITEVKEDLALLEEDDN